MKIAMFSWARSSPTSSGAAGWAPTAGEPSHTDLERSFQEHLGQRQVLFQRRFDLPPDGDLFAALTKEQDHFRVLLLSNIPGPLLIHWGIARYAAWEWFLPPLSMRPPDTQIFAGHTTQTPFRAENNLQILTLTIPEHEAPVGIQFVLRQPETNRWLQFRGNNLFVPVRLDYEQKTGLSSPELAAVVQEIVRAEMGKNSWTLMHRFNLCHDLLERVAGHVDGLALLFVWLRYSAIRQLTWQRQYNTQPRELSHAQERLTHKLAQCYSLQPESRPWIRRMLTSVGPGGEGQRIRDEILSIMHRHHIKEVAGHFLEEWHQKLHNNTTPDDIIICQAYLEFLHTNGNLDRFYQKLAEGSITKQRLETFERPIRSHPDFVPHLKDALIPDFQRFLRVLRSVHEGTDLETALNAARPPLEGDTQDLLRRIWDHRGAHGPQIATLLEDITEVRRRLRPRLVGREGRRDLLYLDLALEQFLRVALERNLHEVAGRDPLVDLIGLALENRQLSAEDAELAVCARHWERLKSQPRLDPDWSLHAKSVTDRIARVLSEGIDRTYQILQPKAELLGHAFHAEAWTITLFSEEVVRGNSVDFVLSLMLRRLEPLLRQTAALGTWQVISRGTGHGIVEVVEHLRLIQGQTFDGPRIVVADHVCGDEEIPEAVVAVIAPDVTDIVSHVAVRARNAGLLFATCYDTEILNHLRALQGRPVRVQVNSAGEVLFTEVVDKPQPAPDRPRPARVLDLKPRFTSYAVAAHEFTPAVVGRKSLNLQLAARLPAWIRLPPSIAVPFGVFVHVLSSEPNQRIAEQYNRLQASVEEDPPRYLPELRAAILKLHAPGDFPAALQQKAAEAGLPWPTKWEKAWRAIKQVWASKWNERAFHSRRTQGVAHADLCMAVLIQQVVDADYAFVIHSVNPFTGNRDELYSEIVVGLGETLVGNYPGRALSCLYHKQSKTPTLLSYPGKSSALRGCGLIFRSDSNGEDLAGYAGAGLYDSVLVPPPQQRLLDYSGEGLVWDESFRRGLLDRIAEIGLAFEELMGAPQDIEGMLAQGQYHVVQTRPQVGLGPA